jgi:hypothetical protein
VDPKESSLNSNIYHGNHTIIKQYFSTVSPSEHGGPITRKRGLASEVLRNDFNIGKLFLQATAF